MLRALLLLCLTLPATADTLVMSGTGLSDFSNRQISLTGGGLVVSGYSGQHSFNPMCFVNQNCTIDANIIFDSRNTAEWQTLGCCVNASYGGIRPHNWLLDVHMVGTIVVQAQGPHTYLAPVQMVGVFTAFDNTGAVTYSLTLNGSGTGTYLGGGFGTHENRNFIFRTTFTLDSPGEVPEPQTLLLVATGLGLLSSKTFTFRRG